MVASQFHANEKKLFDVWEARNSILQKGGYKLPFFARRALLIDANNWYDT